jgi:hypothetical protein
LQTIEIIKRFINLRRDKFMEKYKQILIVMSLLLIGCTKTNITTGNEMQNLMEKKAQIITPCVLGMMADGRDSAKSQEICNCLFDILYSLDSTFIDMNNKEMQNFIDINLDTIKTIYTARRLIL